MEMALLLSTTSNAALFRNLGVNYGQLGDNLPSPAASVHNILSLGAGAVKLYDANHTTLAALSGTRLIVAIMLPNELIPTLAANQSASDAWIATNLVPFHPATRIGYLLVGNEILSNIAIKPTWPLIVPAMTNLHKSLKSYRISGIKLGTTLAMDILQTTSPPSSGEFKPEMKPLILPLLKFLKRTGSYYFVDVYPYFVWAANSTYIDLNYALFKGNSTTFYTDPGTKLTYNNLLDQMLDAVIAAMRRMGYPRIKLAVAETGWPNGGDVDEIGANVYNAAIYNRNLARRLAVRKPAGTPARPGEWMPVFIFSLYNENQKGRPGTERHWGVLYPNSTKVYPVDLAGRSPNSAYPPAFRAGHGGGSCEVCFQFVRSSSGEVVGRVTSVGLLFRLSMTQILASVSHAIRTPMNGVLGMLQMLMDTDLDTTQQDFAMTAQASGKALIALINEVLDQAKIESGRLELETVPFDVRDVLDNVLSLFSDKSQAKGLELAGYISDLVPEVIIGDPGRFRQIITNLVGNSIKVMDLAASQAARIDWKITPNDLIFIYEKEGESFLCWVDH